MKYLTFLIFVSLVMCKLKNQADSSVLLDKFYQKEIGWKSIDKETLLGVDVDSLTLVDTLDQLAVEQLRFNDAKFYYYSILDTSSFYSFVYYYSNPDKEVAFCLVNYSKNRVLLDKCIVAAVSGDGGCFDDTKCNIQNGSTIICENISGCYDDAFNDVETDSANIESYRKVKYSILPNGHIKCDTLLSKKTYRELYK